jgi:hypothetical protein
MVEGDKSRRRKRVRGCVLVLCIHFRFHLFMANSIDLLREGSGGVWWELCHLRDQDEFLGDAKHCVSESGRLCPF